MNGKRIFVLAFILLLVLISIASIAAYSQQQIYKAMNMSFDMNTKFEVYRGENLVIKGNLLNTGWLWLYNVSIFAENLSYEHKIEPSYVDVLPIKYYWVDGKAFRLPKNFSITIKIPENETVGEKEFFLFANASFRVYLPVDMKFLIYPMQIKQRIVLKITPEARINITDITFPEAVFASKPFEVSMVLKNEGEVGSNVNVSIDIPKDWQVDSKTKSLYLNAKENSTLTFEIIPSNSSGQISVYLSYPIGKTIINITKTGPLLVPSIKEEIEKPEEKPGLVERIFSFIRSLPPIVLIIIVVLIGIIIWNLKWLISSYRKRKKPEE